jgi:hypothetical protein
LLIVRKIFSHVFRLILTRIAARQSFHQSEKCR